MTRWIGNINILKIIDESKEETLQALLNTAKAIHAETQTDTFANMYLSSPARKLISKMEKAIAKDMEYEDAEAIFNKQLGKIYDEADLERIWTGG